MKKALPIILLAGAAVLLLSMRRRPRTTVTADMPIRQTEAEFEADFEAATVKPKASLIDAGTNLISNLFTKKPAQVKAARKAQATAVKRAVKTKTATRKQARAVTQTLAKGLPTIRIGASFGDDQVLC